MAIYKIKIEEGSTNETIGKSYTWYVNGLELMLEGEYFNMLISDAKSMERTTIKDEIIKALK